MKLERVLNYVIDGTMVIMGIAASALGTALAIGEHKYNKEVDAIVAERRAQDGSSETNEGE